MKKILVFVVALAVIAVGFAGEQKKYGKKLTLKSKVKISAILAGPNKFNGKRVQVEGEITDVCKNQGCWIEIAEGKDSESIRFKVKDGVIVFPVEAKGKRVVAEGIVSVQNLSKEELIKQGEHHAMEQGITFDSLTVTGPKTVVQIKGEGAVTQ